MWTVPCDAGSCKRNWDDIYFASGVLYTANCYSSQGFPRVLLLAIGCIWMAALPFAPDLSQGTYIDENALQPAMVIPPFPTCVS
jgi:hypothetical protein